MHLCDLQQIEPEILFCNILIHYFIWIIGLFLFSLRFILFNVYGKIIKFES